MPTSEGNRIGARLLPALSPDVAAEDTEPAVSGVEGDGLGQTTSTVGRREAGSLDAWFLLLSSVPALRQPQGHPHRSRPPPQMLSLLPPHLPRHLHPH